MFHVKHIIGIYERLLKLQDVTKIVVVESTQKERFIKI